MYDLRSATLAAAVDNFFVCQPYFAARTPVNGHFVFIGQTLFKQFDKHPLRPFVIFRITGGNATVPVKTETDRLHLFGKIGDVRRRWNGRMHTGFNRIVFCRKPESVKTHRIQNVKTLHSLFAGNNVQSRIWTRMSDMQTGTRRIRKFDQGVKLFLVLVYFNLVSFLVFPNFLPFFFNGMKIVTFFHRPFFFPFVKTGFSVISGIIRHNWLFLSCRNCSAV